MRTELWNIVLAAGAGRRLSSITGGIPKQFWGPDAGPTLLEETLRRSARLARPDRTVIVVDETHAPFVKALPALSDFDAILYQPCDRGTAAGVLLGLTAVAAARRDAMVLLMPSDHGVARPHLFAARIRQASREVKDEKADIVLFGVAPTDAEGDYGWIMPAPGRTRDGESLRPVAAFVEKPGAHIAGLLLESGAVWNTMILVARVSALLDLYRRHLPVLTAVFAGALNRHGEDRAAFLRAEYRTLPTCDFSRDLLGKAEGLFVQTWPTSMGWSDLGTPERLARWHRTHLAEPPPRTSRHHDASHTAHMAR